VKFKYSICIINKNSLNTIESSLNSVMSQLGQEYQLVIVDESTDGSQDRILELQKKWKDRIKVIFLEKKDQRGIGYARNVSIIEAEGKYCVMHIDCDDIWQPHINDFVQVFLEIEKFIGPNFLLAGHQINVARREFLLSIGPYRSVEHGEDRDLWMRLAKRNQYIPIDHVAFFSRLSLPLSLRIIKTLKRTTWGVRDEIRLGGSLKLYIKDLFSKEASLDLKIRMLRLAVYPYSLLTSFGLEKLDNQEHFSSTEQWNSYKNDNFGLYSEIAEQRGFSSSLDFISDPFAKLIFQHRRKELEYQQLQEIYYGLGSGKGNS
jgi:glycosyltransferase involved in cell wall biosynthesis